MSAAEQERRNYVEVIARAEQRAADDVELGLVNLRVAIDRAAVRPVARAAAHRRHVRQHVFLVEARHDDGGEPGAGRRGVVHGGGLLGQAPVRGRDAAWARA